jgi:hypothetical protein
VKNYAASIPQLALYNKPLTVNLNWTSSCVISNSITFDILRYHEKSRNLTRARFVFMWDGPVVTVGPCVVVYEGPKRF